MECQNDEIIICAGRGWGKSAICGYIAVEFFLDRIFEIKQGKYDSCKVWVVASSYELTGKVFEYIVKFLLSYDRQFGKYISGGQGGRPYQLKMNESIWIQCKSSSEPMSLLGERVDLEIVDEAPLVPSKIYHQNIKPSISAIGGKVYFIGTPRGKNWFKDKFYALKEKNAAFNFTSAEGKHYTETALEELKKTTPELLYRQEYLAEFVDDAGTVFRFLERIIVPSSQILSDGLKDRHYIMGIDLAEMEDYTVVTVIDTTTNNVVHIDRFKGRDYPLQKEQIYAKARRYNNARIIIDATGVGRPVYEDLLQAGLFIEDFSFTGKTKEELIGKLIVFCEEKYIRIPDIPELLDEMKSYQYITRNERTGETLKNIKYGAPQGFHDDMVSSLALAVWGLFLGKPPYKTKLDFELKKGRFPKKPKSFI